LLPEISGQFRLSALSELDMPRRKGIITILSFALIIAGLLFYFPIEPGYDG